jgi:hypothetical protein
MDPITTAILAAIAVSAAKVGAQILVDAYGSLEELPVKEFEPIPSWRWIHLPPHAY